MELSSPRFKAVAVSAGISFWFAIISLIIGIFSYELLFAFVIPIVVITQIFAVKLSKGLDIFAIFNTKIFLGILFVFVISVYGLIFKLLHIDLLRLQKQDNTYWLEIPKSQLSENLNQY